MKPDDDAELQIPLYEHGGHKVQINGEYILLEQGGNYQGLTFSEIDFTSMTISANFEGSNFSHCHFYQTDLSGSTLSSAHFHDSYIGQTSLMWTKSNDVKFSNTVMDEVHFAFSDCRGAQFLSDTTLLKVDFRDALLGHATFNESGLADCEFLGTVAPHVTIDDCYLLRVHISKSHFPFLKISDSQVDFLGIASSNVSDSSWRYIFSEHGSWEMGQVDFTGSHFSICDAKKSKWDEITFRDVVIERCNFFENLVSTCSFGDATMNSVNWNETKFEVVTFENLNATALRLRFATFLDCIFINSKITDSSFEFCELSTSVAENLQLVRPTYSEDTLWHVGYTPETEPRSTNHPTTSQKKEH